MRRAPWKCGVIALLAMVALLCGNVCSADEEVMSEFIKDIQLQEQETREMAEVLWRYNIGA